MRASALALLTVLALCGCDRQRDTAPAPTPTAPLVSTLQIKDTRMGDGAEVQPGSTAVVHYTGWLYDQNSAGNRGRKFDSSRDRGEPFRFRVGAGNVIQGWDEGVVGMKVNGQRELVIPSSLGYGPQGAGGVIPPNAPLVFEIELLEVR